MFKKITITCDKASAICDKTQYDEASLFEKIQLKSHLLICKICCEYIKHNKTMTRIFRMKIAKSKGEVNRCLSTVDKEAIKNELEELV